MNLKYDDKVHIPKTKSNGCDLEASSIVRSAILKNQDFLYFKGFEESEGENVIILHHMPKDDTGDFFHLIEDKITPYLNSEQLLTTIL